jgi:hypothetical protein
MSGTEIKSPRFGIALFDNPNEALTGLCSLAGGEPVRFRTIGDLLSDCIWVTNMSFQQAFAVRLHNNPKIKLSNFFRVELSRIATELNLDIQNEPNRAIKTLSLIADRTATLATRVYHTDRYKDSLRKTIEDALLPGSEPEQTPFIASAIDNSFKAYQNCWGARSPGHVDYYLRFQRTTYAKMISQLPVPKGNWRRVNDKCPLKNGTTKSGTESRIFKFLEALTERQPALLKVSVSDVDPSVAHLLDYGNGTEQREWLPVQEIAQIAAYADVTILDMFLADDMEFIGESLAGQMSYLDASQQAGYSFGLLAENHLHALFSKRKLPNNGRFESVTPSRASWLRAWDRVICFSVAAEIEKHGFRVLSYGIGNIQVSAAEKDLKRLSDVAKQLKLTMPMAMVAHMNSLSEYEDLIGASTSGSPEDGAYR